MIPWYQRLQLFVNAILFSFLVISLNSGINAMEDTATKNYNQSKHPQNMSASGYGYTCTFDNGMCGWSQSYQDAIDWTRWSGSTPSRFTGPLSDHTGSGKYYLYIECSGKQFNANATIIGPSFYTTPSTPYCFSLWYNMYGIAIGILGVYIKHSGHNFQRIWTKSGDQGQAWSYADVTVTGFGYIQIAIEGFVGRGFEGDIAIDDTHLKPGACKGSPTTAVTSRRSHTTSLARTSYTSKMPMSVRTSTGPETLSGYNCTFDTSTCGWHQSSADVFDWTRHAGVTMSSGTGPSNDHTTFSRVGKYMYIEASAPRIPGDNAKLFGPFFINEKNTMYCFSFWYNMFDGHLTSMGTLNVFVRNHHYTFLKWTKTGNQGRDWNEAKVTIEASSNIMQIVIEGIRGSSYTGDIAIDDTSVTSGKCENTVSKKTPARNQKPATTQGSNHNVTAPSIIVIVIISSSIVLCLLCIVSIRQLRKNSRQTDTNTRRISRRRNVTDELFTISDSQMEAISSRDRSRDNTLHNEVENTSAHTNRRENQGAPPDYETLYTENDGQETEARRENNELDDTNTPPVRSHPPILPSISLDTNEDSPPPNYWSLPEAHFWQCNGRADDSNPPPYPGNSD